MVECPICKTVNVESASTCRTCGRTLSRQEQYRVRQGKSVWFWAGVFLLSISSLFWLILVIGMTTDPGDTGDIISGGIMVSLIPIAMGIYALKRARKSQAIPGRPFSSGPAIPSETGVERPRPETDQSTLDVAKDNEGRAVIAKHKVWLGGFWHLWPLSAKTLCVTDGGVYVEEKLNVPYGSVVDIALRVLGGACVLLRYTGESGRQKELMIVPQRSGSETMGNPNKGIKLYGDVVKGSAYRIRQRPHKKLCSNTQSV